MFESQSKPTYQLSIESELERALTALKAETVGEGEYMKALARVERLHGLLETDKPKPLSKEAMLNAAVNLLGIVLIIKHENVNVIASKALGFVARTR